MAEDDAADDPTSSSPAAKPPKDGGKSKNRSGMVARMWRGIFGGGGGDYEKKLKFLSKEEASVHARMRRRALRSRRTARNVIVFSILLELVAVTYAIMTTRPQDLDWKTRALRVLPMFALPLLSIIMYSALTYLTKMFVLKDQRTLERLRAERQEKIDELKERTNYYKIQQLIQRYDLDPAAKAAAATVLASKLGADSGLKVFLGDESVPTGRSKDVELEQSKGFPERKQSQLIDDTSIGYNTAEHYRGSNPNDGGWLARIAALLVGEDPTQCYALICGNCHMHNGLARKEDFAYITYYCPHCHVLNCSQRGEDNVLEWSSGKDTPSAPGNGSAINNATSLSGTPIASKASPLEGMTEAVEEISES